MSDEYRPHNAIDGTGDNSPIDLDKQLWCAVISQAIEDATSPGMGKDIKRIRDSARRWLTTPSRDFCDVCAFAGLLPEKVRAAAIRIIAEHDAKVKAGIETKFHTFSHAGETLTIRQWSERLGFSVNLISHRLKSGQTIGDIIANPVRPRHKPYDELLTHDGKTQNVKDWAKELGISHITMHQRLKKYAGDPDRIFARGKLKTKTKSENIEPQECAIDSTIE